MSQPQRGLVLRSPTSAIPIFAPKFRMGSPTRLKLQCVGHGLCPSDVTVKLGLIHGHATSPNAPLLAGIFEREGWLLFGPAWPKDHLSRMAASSYENSTSAVVASPGKI